jgi:tungstate transport system ATP-binding protein
MDPLYQLDRLRHHYNGHTVLAIDGWTLPAGRITGLVGANGCGKSTLLKLLGFIERPAEGEILFNGRRTTSRDEAARRTVVLLPQESHLLKRTVFANVAYGLRVRQDRDQERARVAQALEWVGLPSGAFARRPWFALSGGEARRVALAARLALRPQVLLLDEPTTSVDGASAQRMKAAALYAHRQWGTSLIIASHDLPWLQEICDDVIHIFAGRILGTGLQSLLYGPWQALGADRVAMALTDGQQFVALRPSDPAEATVAAIDPRRLTLLAADQAPSEVKAVMEGILTGLTLDQRAGGINASVRVGHTEFRVHLPADHPALVGLAPGRPARIAYAPDDVRWYA